MALPEGHKPRSKQEWMDLATDEDAKNRRVVSSCLRALGVDPSDYMTWKAEERVEAILKAQGDASAEEESSSTNGKTAAGSSKNGKSSGKGKGNGAATSSAVGGIDEATAKRIAKMEEQIDDLQQTQAELLAFIKDQHFLTRVLVQSNKQLKENCEDEDLQEVLYGNLVVSEGNEG